MSALGGVYSWGCGLLLWPSVVVFCYALLLWPSGLVPSDSRWPSGMVFGGPEGHNRRPPHQKTPHQKAITEGTIPEGTTPEGHYTRRHHTRRPPHQKATTERGCLVEKHPPPPGRLLLRVVRILLECILVCNKDEKEKLEIDD